VSDRHILTAVAWPYANGPRHIGHVSGFGVPSDVFSRYHRMAGDKVEILPGEVRLMLGVKDVLVLRNRDDVPQVFGPVLMMPGQSFKLPFEMASSYQFACSAHASGQMTVAVEPAPAAGWERLAWRTRALIGSGGWAWRS